MSIRFGPAGLGGVKEAEENLEKFSKLGLRACEIAFTYGIYIKNKQDAVRIGKKAKELDIKLSIHAPYWLNLNSKEKIKIEQSKISHALTTLKCCNIVKVKQKGKQRIYFLNKNTIIPMLKLIDKHAKTFCKGFCQCDRYKK